MRSSNIGLIRNESIIMKNLIIIGARGWGREVYAAAISCAAYRRGEYAVKGFLDSKSHAFDGLQGDYPPILGDVETYIIQPDDIFFVAMGEPKWRKYYAELIERKGGHFMTIICDTARVVPTATIGDGSFVSYNSIVSDGVVLGQHVVIHAGAIIGHDVHIGCYGTLEALAFVGGKAEIGDESILHVRATLIRHKRIGKRVEVGAHSLVMRNLQDDVHVFGNPARKVEW